MHRTDFAALACPIARTADLLGDPWMLLIVRDVYAGITRFDALQADLQISRKVLTERLTALVAGGVLARRPYSATGTRVDYLLTEKGQQFCDVLLVIGAWGNRWTSGADGPPVRYRHRTCGHLARPELVCSVCSGPFHAATVDPEPSGRTTP